MPTLFSFTPEEILETIRMVQVENLDIRTITLGISLRDCTTGSLKETCRRVYDKITRRAEKLVAVGEEVATAYGIPIVNKRIAVTPIAQVGEPSGESDLTPLARTLDLAAEAVGVNFIGGFSALVHKGFTKGDRAIFKSLPEALATTERVCASINVATTRAGMNMDAIAELGQLIKETAQLTADRGGIGCAKLVTFCNAPEDNPFMAGAFHGPGEPECVLNVGISGPGVVLAAVRQHPEADLGKLATIIKNTAFKVTRMGELVGREVSARLGVPFGIVDLSLAPTNALGDSVAEILEAIGLERCGAHGTTAALALLNDAVKKGGAMASSYVGGLSGAFIPVSEDNGMIRAVESGALSLEKLEAMTAVCSVGLDMFAIPGDTPADVIAAIIADEAAIGMINNKTTAVRVIPVPGKKPGDMVEFGGLLGRAPVMDVNNFSPAVMIRRGGRIPAPLQALGN
ncbi:PFL family protein [Moorella sulfitireducens]|uniref:PFL family protein n=1 Tax=Neomoorella sulfitireducens TaxID=2972948 RepID=UPI0021AB9F51|nr:PFL family protein [Moorella sulfitireducens]